ncbi:hypothetical protein [Arthrobacter cavernae]|uniref:Uncharacterized protein n=1 Tax=Arthrobacter cavernae TaxID=2817681 RepID=A0A939HLX5_9MICC|nr:hypothetical protein [Arthrobacter cavernae]MBO1269750.1 hypothetical protein [Arthrobacter cavernae]
MSILAGVVLAAIGAFSLAGAGALYSEAAEIRSLPVESLRMNAKGQDVGANVRIADEIVPVDFSGVVPHQPGEVLEIRFVPGSHGRAVMASVSREQYEGGQRVLLMVGLAMLAVAASWRPFIRRMAVRKYMPDALSALRVGSPLPERVDY